mmetsp:Transcript_40943/g.132671  ORF Transcript_40943/g.132671 Transcript_40943/m.132671 type:complete len:283 (+) Transcript_40943:100-948(+)
MVLEAAPLPTHLLHYLLTLGVAALLGVVAFNTLSRPRDFLTACGVALTKVQRTAAEIERKTFHIAGLLVPTTHQFLLAIGFKNIVCVQICVVITVVGWTLDLLRVAFPGGVIARNWPLASLLRESERQKLTGGCYFSLGCTLTIAFSPPSIATVSMLFLILGDMSAAIIGVSFGGETCTMRLGRQGKKSLEGSLAMFAVCFATCCSVFLSVELREYPAFAGALAATLVELHEPFGINDNLTIPIISSLAMQWAFSRVAACDAPETIEWVRAMAQQAVHPGGL